MQTKTASTHVTIGKGKEKVEKTIPAGPTPIPTLKNEARDFAADRQEIPDGSCPDPAGDAASCATERVGRLRFDIRLASGTI
jgi:hypothetical protein